MNIIWLIQLKFNILVLGLDDFAKRRCYHIGCQASARRRNGTKRGGKVAAAAPA
ncbi:conserved hypothetical protein [Ricinus communis]|uniref:Uncharacterized protein n=1 Tax=Ricinus communis TaxID=3988 RepID=B9SJD3_RICCO|nr:conserved hypothetical protein [Ricinus communis]